MRCGSLFSGPGLLDYGLHLAGIEHEWFVESVEFRRRLLGMRFPGCELHDDVRTFDALRAPPVDLIAGGFPCRGASTAGPRNGFDHPETALWHEFARIIGDARPRYVLIENVANLLAIHDGAVWGTVLRDLAALGFDAWWDCLPAAAFGAPHLRDRVFLVAVANASSEGWQPRAEGHAARNGRGHHARRDAGDAAADAHGRRGPGASELHESAGRATARRHTRDAADDPRDGCADWAERRPPASGPHAAHGSRAAAHADSAGLRQQPESESERSGAPQPGRRTPTPADDHRDGREEQPQLDEQQAPLRREHGRRRGSLGSAFPWGRFEPAIRRWEAIHGPAPEPFVPRVADGSTRGVDGPRIAALGDGVLVHAGQYVGELLMALDRTEGANGA